MDTGIPGAGLVAGVPRLDDSAGVGAGGCDVAGVHDIPRLHQEAEVRECERYCAAVAEELQPIAEICAPRIILDILYVVEKHFDARRSGKSLFLSAARELSGVRAEAVNGRKFGRWGLRVAAVGLTVSSTTTSGGSTGLFTSEWCLLLAGTDDLDGGTGVLSESFSGS